MKKLDMGEGISNAEREEEAHGRKNTEEQSKPQTKEEQTIQAHAHGKRQNATATTDFHGWISASIHLSTSSASSCWFFFHFCLFLFLFLGVFLGGEGPSKGLCDFFRSTFP